MYILERPLAHRTLEILNKSCKNDICRAIPQSPLNCLPRIFVDILHGNDVLNGPQKLLWDFKYFFLLKCLVFKLLGI